MLKWGDLEKYKIFRVFVVLIVCVSLSVSVLAVPVFAAVYPFQDPFDYGLPYNTRWPDVERSNSVWLEDNDILQFDIPKSSLYYVELVVKAPKGTLNGVTWYYGSGNVRPMTKYQIDDTTFRFVYPNVGWTKPYLQFQFDFSSGGDSVFIISCKYSSVPFNYYDEVGSLSVTQSGISQGTQTMPDANTSVAINFGGNSSVTSQSTWYANITCSNWRSYDYIDFKLSALVLSIDSISVTVGDQSIPFEVSYLDVPPDGSYDTDSSSNNRKRVNISVSVDLTSVFKGDENLLLYISGTSTLSNGTSANSVSLVRVTGLLEVSGVSALGFWFQSLFSRLEAWFTGLGDRIEAIFNPEEASDNLQSAVDEHESQMDSIDQIEQGLITDFGEHKGAVTGAFNVGSFAVALTFCSSILQRTFNNLGDYQIVIILPVALGIVLFVCSRIRGVDVARKNNVDTTAMSADASRRSPHADVSGDDFRDSSFYDSDRDQSPL